MSDPELTDSEQEMLNLVRASGGVQGREGTQFALDLTRLEMLGLVEYDESGDKYVAPPRDAGRYG